MVIGMMEHQACTEGLGEIFKRLRREGADIKVSKMFYRVVVQDVLLLGLESWVLLVAMEKIM